jgi:hypothetical protein
VLEHKSVPQGGADPMHIEIVKHPIKDCKSIQIRVVDAEGRTLRVFTYPTIDSARRAARAWTVAYGNCPIRDKSWKPVKE